ncbi:MAG: 16S rRNA (adenine(1518)-N(6)/adenine(1519)-N(6))-dimethyltransferase RsmA [Candidatus Moranbacteria bacterium]|nr:16S rRNA (adenine(1518)-N(6)/adenine(1519)-N(6))-dimethyltransferase RsmA [Candidatus Moranbacteria bacterium]
MEKEFKAKPKKSLGQNFLKDNSVVERIAVSANLDPDDVVLEIGPGQGVLSQELMRYVRKVVAVELDKNLVEGLEKKFQDEEGFEVVHGDILTINLTDMMAPYQYDGYKVVANIPYYITSKIIRLFLESDNPPKEMILMMQLEVANRILAESGQMSILAVSVQYYADVEFLIEVDRECFEPVPEVDSAVVRIIPKNSEDVRDKEKNKAFFRIVKAGFSARRKTLLNNLANGLHLEKVVVQNILENNGFNIYTRAQELSVENWKKLRDAFEALNE